MSRKIRLRPCACGCGTKTNATFARGHDRRVEAAILKHLDTDVVGLRKFIETATGRPVVVEQPEASE